jgi:hypothetical protein
MPKMAPLSAPLRRSSWQILREGHLAMLIFAKKNEERAFSQLMYPVHVFNSSKVRNQNDI